MYQHPCLTAAGLKWSAESGARWARVLTSAGWLGTKAYHQIIFSEIFIVRGVFWSLFMVQIEVKDDFLLKKEVLPLKMPL